MKFSDQAVGAVMMALQKSLMDQTDIVPVLQGFKLDVDDTNQVIVTNPPMVKMKAESPGTTTTETTK